MWAGRLVFARLALLGISALAAQASGIVECRSGAELVAALADGAVDVISLPLPFLELKAEDFAGHDLPIVLNRDLVIQGGVPTKPVTLDLGFVRGMVRLGNGTTLTMRYLVFVDYRSGSTNQAPGMDLLLPMPPSETALLFWHHVAVSYHLCFPPYILKIAAAMIVRPAELPGNNTYDVTIPWPTANCSNSTAAHVYDRCWVNVGRHVDIAGYGADLDATGKPVNNGILLHVIDQLNFCEQNLSDQCITQLGPLGCLLYMQSRSLQPSPPSPSPPVDGTGAPLGGGGGSGNQPGSQSSDGGGGGGGGRAAVLAIVLGCVLGGAAALGLLTAAALLFAWRQEHKPGWCSVWGWRLVARSRSRPASCPEAGSPGPGAETPRKKLRTSSDAPTPLGEAGALAAPPRSSLSTDSTMGEVAVAISGLGGGRGDASTVVSTIAAATASATATATTTTATATDLSSYSDPAADPQYVLVTRQTPCRPSLDLAVRVSGPGPATGGPAARAPFAGPASGAPAAAAGGPAGSEVRLLRASGLGQGAFGQVVEGVFQGRRVAVKLVADTQAWAGPTEALLRTFEQEVAVLGRCDHPNVVQLLAACLKPPRLCLVMELMETSLDRLLYGSGRGGVGPARLPLAKALHIGVEVARGLEFLHPSITHRDLKPANILLTHAHHDRPIVKITDFGLSRLRSTVRITRHPDAGTPGYMSPECFDVTSNSIVTPKADVFSLGVMLWEMLARQRPFGGRDPLQVARCVAEQRLRPSLLRLAGAGEEGAAAGRPPPPPPRLLALIAQCWEHDPFRRPAAAEVCKELAAILQEVVAARGAAAWSDGDERTAADQPDDGRRPLFSCDMPFGQVRLRQVNAAGPHAAGPTPDLTLLTSGGGGGSGSEDALEAEAGLSAMWSFDLPELLLVSAARSPAAAAAGGGDRGAGASEGGAAARGWGGAGPAAASAPTGANGAGEAKPGEVAAAARDEGAGGAATTVGASEGEGCAGSWALESPAAEAAVAPGRPFRPPRPQPPAAEAGLASLLLSTPPTSEAAGALSAGADARGGAPHAPAPDSGGRGDGGGPGGVRSQPLSPLLLPRRG